MIKAVITILLFILPLARLCAQAENFPPPASPPVIYAVEAKTAITLDGHLKEPDWKEAPVTKDFFRIEPRQGGEYRFPSFVQVLFDRKNLYFGVFCKDSLGKKGMRVQDMKRDFDFSQNDNFYISLDPQNTKRFCVSFMATPLGNQRDVQVFDDAFRDEDWDALWRVKTSFTDSGYYAEFAIPFSTLRYNKANGDTAVSWGVSFSRFARREYEQTAFPPVPQAFSPQRMSYAAQLKGLKLPPPSANIRIQPYVLLQSSKSTNAAAETETNTQFKTGGEIKWAINPSSVLDITFNTDFAQADVDRAVNNLTRFNVLFPERRQFFLENSGIYAGTDVRGLKPFFSRSIGLDNTQFNAGPVPIDAGIRYASRNQKRTWAGLYVHQRETASQGAANFAVLRYLGNYGEQNNAGIMVTHRLDEGDRLKGFKQNHNTTVSVDGFIRPKNDFNIQYLVTASRDNTNERVGLAGNFWAEYTPNKMYAYWKTTYIDKKYTPGMGFIFATNTLYNNAGGYFIWRPKGRLEKLIRRWDPGFFIDYYNNANDLKFQSAELYIFPVFIVLQSGGFIQYALYPTWQNINFDFSVLGMPVAQQQYYYTRHQFDYNTDRSKKLSFDASYSGGRYYNGRLNSCTAGIRYAPLPQAAVTFDYALNAFRNFGTNKTDKNTSLYTGGIRLAWNPKIQLSGFYQYNSFDRQGRWNVRGSWEFAPLSFLYIVFNENSFSHSPVRNSSVINKITYLKQF